ncbi:MAG: fatty-acid synthase [Spirulina sp. SIO3F2]|nr:fatty-acid synthase [Spirulina sp. SIO3F2]
MPAKDIYHETVKAALIKEGWIVKDELPLKVGKRDLFTDLQAEKILIAQRAHQKIAIEVKSFINPSPVSDLEKALGQYLLYEALLRRQYPDYTLYLAIRETVYSSFFQEEIAQIVLKRHDLNLLIFDEIQEEIIQWQP